MGRQLGMNSLFVLGMVLLLAGVASAGKIPDMTGTWIGPSYVAYHGSGGSGTLTTGNLDLVVTYQDENGSFYGTFFGDPIVGSITADKVINAILQDGTTFGIFNAKWTSKKILGTLRSLNSGGNWIQINRFELIKQ
jgi:hypothetical protein